MWSERNAREHDERTRSVQEFVKWTSDIALDLAIAGRSSSRCTSKVRAR